MKAVIMVAGVGSRLSKKVKHLPKCLLTFGGETILSRNIRILREHGISDVIVVAGYRASLVQEEIQGAATCVINPFFRVTNSLASLWFADRQVDLHDDLMIFNGDVIYEEGVLRKALDAPKSPTMLIDTSVIERADYRLKVQDDYVIHQGKDLSNEETSGEYVGFAKLNKDFVPMYLSRVRDLVDCHEKYGMWWEEALFAIRDEFRMKIHVADVKGLFWAEADYIEDVERIEQWFRQGAIQANA
jgi:L-glutamine-phosphate cytidylyltransferase